MQDRQEDSNQFHGNYFVCAMEKDMCKINEAKEEDPSKDFLADLSEAVPIKMAPKKHFLFKNNAISIDKVHHDVHLGKEMTETKVADCSNNKNKSHTKMVNMRSCIEAIVVSELQKDDSSPNDESNFLQILSSCNDAQNSKRELMSLIKQSAHLGSDGSQRFTCSDKNSPAVSQKQDKKLAEISPRKSQSSNKEKGIDVTNSQGLSPNYLPSNKRHVAPVQNLPMMTSDLVETQNRASLANYLNKSDYKDSLKLVNRGLLSHSDSVSPYVKENRRKPEGISELKAFRESDLNYSRFSIDVPSGLSHNQFSSVSQNTGPSIVHGTTISSGWKPERRFISANTNNANTSIVGYHSLISNLRYSDVSDMDVRSYEKYNLPRVVVSSAYDSSRSVSSAHDSFRSVSGARDSFQPVSDVLVSSGSTSWFTGETIESRNVQRLEARTQSNVGIEREPRQTMTDVEIQDGLAWKLGEKDFLHPSLTQTSCHANDKNNGKRGLVSDCKPLDLSNKRSNQYHMVSATSETARFSRFVDDQHNVKVPLLHSSTYSQNMARHDLKHLSGDMTNQYPEFREVSLQQPVGRHAQHLGTDLQITNFSLENHNRNSGNYSHEVNKLTNYWQQQNRRELTDHKSYGAVVTTFQNAAGIPKNEFIMKPQQPLYFPMSSSHCASNVLSSRSEHVDYNHPAVFSASSSTYPQSSMVPVRLLSPSMPALERADKYLLKDHARLNEHVPVTCKEEYVGKFQGFNRAVETFSNGSSRLLKSADSDHVSQPYMVTPSRDSVFSKNFTEFGQEMSKSRSYFSEYLTTESGQEMSRPRSYLSDSPVDSPVALQTPSVLSSQKRQGSKISGSIKNASNSLLGSHSPNDILHLQCKLCSMTYGSLRSFRMHFAKAHGQEPQPHDFTVLTISEAKSVLAKYSKPETALPALERLPHRNSSRQSIAVCDDNISGHTGSQLKTSVDRSDNVLAVSKTKQIAEVYPMPARISTASTILTSDDTDLSTLKGDFSEVDVISDDDRFTDSQLPQEYKTTSCAFCQERFDCPEKWKLHMNSVHLMFPCECKVCNISFSCPKTLGKHLATVHHFDVEHDSLFYKEQFNAEEALYKHVEREHEQKYLLLLKTSLEGRCPMVASKISENDTEKSRKDISFSEERKPISSRANTVFDTPKKKLFNDVKLSSAVDRDVVVCTSQNGHAADGPEKIQFQCLAFSSSSVKEGAYPKRLNSAIGETSSSSLGMISPVSESVVKRQSQNIQSSKINDDCGRKTETILQEINNKNTNAGHQAREPKPHILSKKTFLLRRYQDEDLHEVEPELMSSEVVTKVKGHSASDVANVTTRVSPDGATYCDEFGKSECYNSNSHQPPTLRHLLDSLLVAEVQRISTSPPVVAASSSTFLQNMVASKFFQVEKDSATEVGIKEEEQTQCTVSSGAASLSADSPGSQSVSSEKVAGLTFSCRSISVNDESSSKVYVNHEQSASDEVKLKTDSLTVSDVVPTLDDHSLITEKPISEKLKSDTEREQNERKETSSRPLVSNSQASADVLPFCDGGSINSVSKFDDVNVSDYNLQLTSINHGMYGGPSLPLKRKYDLEYESSPIEYDAYNVEAIVKKPLLQKAVRNTQENDL